MKKTKLISLVLLAAFVLMGAGYAYWTDTVTITNNIHTGDFNVVFEDCTLPDAQPDPYVTINATKRDDHTIFLDINGIYPGGGGGYCFRIENKGTIPAKFDKVVASNIQDPDSLNANRVLTYTGILQAYDLNDLPVGGPKLFNSSNTVEGIADKMAKVLANWNGTGNPIILQPGQYILVSSPEGESVGGGYTVYMDELEEGHENCKLGFDLSVYFKQWNQ